MKSRNILYQVKETRVVVVSGDNFLFESVLGGQSLARPGHDDRLFRDFLFALSNGIIYLSIK